MFLCYECKSLVEMAILNPFAEIFEIPPAIDYTVEAVVDKIKNGKIKKIAIMSGAGLSVSAGIPDFRSPKSGLYNNLKGFYLPFPQAIFTLFYFKWNPGPFYTIFQRMIKKYFPTKAHYFIRLLQDKGILLTNFTQNIDGLEIDAGINPDRLFQAHGKITSSHCASCRAEVDQELIMSHLIKGEPLYCSQCKGPCKPDVVLFGEYLPDGFSTESKKIALADLVIVMGTSLEVTPFADIIQMANPKVPRLIIDKVVPKKISKDDNRRNILMLGDADETVEKLVDMLGYRADFEKLMKEREEMIKKYEEDKAKGIAKPY